MKGLILDGTKALWHLDRIKAWAAGKRIAPITVDMALTPRCQYRCQFCYAKMQRNPVHGITWGVTERFLNDAAEIGVKGVVLMSDGESTLAPFWRKAIRLGHDLGLSMAMATNGYLFTPDAAEEVLSHMTYVRINFEGATPESYAKIMGVKPAHYRRVVDNIKAMVAIKERDRLPVTIGMQQVLMPQHAGEVIPLARLAKVLRVDYLVVKHCSDNLEGTLGIKYSDYHSVEDVLKQAEALSTRRTRIMVKWSKIQAGKARSYQRCYGPPFLLQISGTGLVAACGPLFSKPEWAIGNIVDTPFKEIWKSDRYWEVMNKLRSPEFDTARDCGGYLCVQHNLNVWLDNWLKGGKPPVMPPTGQEPAHVAFV